MFCKLIMYLKYFHNKTNNRQYEQVTYLTKKP